MAGLKGINPVLKVILQGVHDENSKLHCFRFMPHVVELIWKQLGRLWKKQIKKFDHYRNPWIDPYLEGQAERLETVKNAFPVSDPFYNYSFPDVQNININMMPFINGKTFKECRLPDNLEPYWHHIMKFIVGKEEKELGKVWYLTVQESHVEAGVTQRRPGLHTDRPGVLYTDGIRIENSINNFIDVNGTSTLRSFYIDWGDGFFDHKFLEGGIYMTSSVDESCRVWNCQILPDEDGNEIIGELGDIEHLREFLPGEPRLLDSGRIYWITDRTPHESVPKDDSGVRQFIRIVTSNVSAWFEAHSTKNPLGVQPDPKVTKIICGSKFVKNSMRFTSN